MKNKHVLTVLRFLFIIYILYILFFIFRNSFASVQESAEQSSIVTGTINKLLKLLNLPSVRDEIIRKIAHFTEFFWLGSSLACGRLLFIKIKASNTVYCIFFCVLSAMTDETIQYFTDRGSMLTDVWIDSTGATMGVLLFTLLILIIKKLNDNKVRMQTQTKLKSI